MNPIDTISVHIREYEDILADGAKLDVLISGSALFSSSEALKKARELASLVQALLTCGLMEEDIELLNVSAEVNKGMVSRTSSARYQLRIHCSDLSLFPALLGVLTDHKQLEIQRTQWSYSGLKATRERMLERAMDQVKIRAEHIAAAMKLSLDCVHSFKEQFYDPDEVLLQSQDMMLGTMARGRAKSSLPLEFGMEVSHRKSLRLELLVDYRVS